MMTDMAAAVKSGEFREDFLNALRSMLGWKLMQKVLEKKTRSERQQILSESFHQKELEIGIQEACTLGMIGTVEFLIEKCDVNVEKIKESCVWSAVPGQHSCIMKYFIEKHSVDVNLQNNQGTRIIHFACLAGDEGFVKYLANKGADLTSVDNKNVNCLMAGAWAGSVKICEMAIRAGVDVDAKSSNGEHVLHGTIRRCRNLNQSRIDVIDYLIKAGADVNSVNGDNMPVVIYAALALNGCTKTLGYFLKHPQVNAFDKIDAIKFAGAFLINSGHEKRGFKFWTRAVELQERLNGQPGNENDNFASRYCDFSCYEPACVADILEMKSTPIFPIKCMVALMAKLHIKYGYDCIFHLQSLMDVVISLGLYDFYLEIFSFVFLHTFPDDENVSSILDFENAFRVICAILAWKHRKGDEIFPDVLKFFEKMTTGFEKKQFSCKKVITKSAEEDLIPSQKDIILNMFCFLSDTEDGDGSDSDESSVRDDYKDGKHKNMYMKLMVKLSALIIETFPTHKEEFIPSLLKLLKTNFRDEKQSTFLHIAIDCVDTSLVYHGDEESQAELVKIMIENGEDVNATDNYLCTPVHDLARVVYSGNRKLIQEILDLMVQHGAHLDIRNKTGWSGLDELRDFEVTVHPVANQSLQCLAAQVIKANKLDYHSCTPKALWNFIELHDPEEHVIQDEIPYAYFSQERDWFSREEHVCDVY